MKPFKDQIGPALFGVAAGVAGLSTAAFCQGNCSSCFGCLAAGGAILLAGILKMAADTTGDEKREKDIPL